MIKNTVLTKPKALRTKLNLYRKEHLIGLKELQSQNSLILHRNSKILKN